MTSKELLACLVDRPCGACKFHTERGCSKWSCVFEDKIEELPSAEVKGDLISKKTVIDMLEDINAETEGVGFYYDHWVEYIKQLPSAERVGKWIEKEDPYGFFNSIPVCSECGCTTKMREKTNYCPTCGANMRGEEE